MSKVKTQANVTLTVACWCLQNAASTMTLSNTLDLFATLSYTLYMEWWTILGVIVGTVGGILGAVSFTRTIRRQRPRFDVTFKEPGTLYGEDEKAEFVVIYTTISNVSDVANSIVEYGLIIGHPYSLSTEPLHYSYNSLGESVLETTDMAKRLAVQNTKFKWLETPVNLSSHKSTSGVIGFPLPSIPRNLVKAIEYALVIIPSEGQPSLIPLITDIYEWNKEPHTITVH